MKLSTKLGIASILLVGSVLIPPYSDWRGPINFAASWISFTLGLLAAQRGSKWWLAVPCLILCGFGFGLYLTANTP